MRSKAKAKWLAIVIAGLLPAVVIAADQGTMGGPGHGKQDHGTSMNHMADMMQNMASHMAGMSKMMTKESMPPVQQKSMAAMMDMMAAMMKDMSGMMGKGMMMDDATQKKMLQMHQQMKEMMDKGPMK